MCYKKEILEIEIRKKKLEIINSGFTGPEFTGFIKLIVGQRATVL